MPTAPRLAESIALGARVGTNEVSVIDGRTVRADGDSANVRLIESIGTAVHLQDR